MNFKHIIDTLAYIGVKLRIFTFNSDKKDEESTLKKLQKSGKIKNQDAKLTWDDIYDIL